MSEINERNGKRVLIPDADELAAAIRDLPAGKSSDLGAVRRALAEKNAADLCCPVTTQRLLVQFSEQSDIPYWRVVNADKPFAKRLVGGADRVRQELARES